MSEDEYAHIKAGLGADFTEPFFVPEDVRDAWRRVSERGRELTTAWDALVEEYVTQHPVGGSQLQRWSSGEPIHIDIASLIETPRLGDPLPEPHDLGRPGELFDAAAPVGAPDGHLDRVRADIDGRGAGSADPWRHRASPTWPVG